MPRPAKKYTPPALTPERLDQIALRYVSRYAASEGMLSRVLERHLKKALLHTPDLETAPLQKKIAAIVSKAAAKGWVDDEGLAKRMVEQGRAAGLSRRKIIIKLQTRGITPAMMRELFAQEDDSAESDLQAARIFAKRKHLGRHRKAGKKAADDEAAQRKDLAKMCRAGFSFTTARQALGLTGGTEED